MVLFLLEVAGRTFVWLLRDFLASRAWFHINAASSAGDPPSRTRRSASQIRSELAKRRQRQASIAAFLILALLVGGVLKAMESQGPTREAPPTPVPPPPHPVPPPPSADPTKSAPRPLPRSKVSRGVTKVTPNPTPESLGGEAADGETSDGEPYVRAGSPPEPRRNWRP